MFVLSQARESLEMGWNMKRYYLIILVFFIAIGITTESWAEVLTLEEAIAFARERSPQIAMQTHMVESAQAQLSEAKYYWSPKFALKSQFGPMPKTTDIESSENDIWSNFFDSWGFTTRNSLEFWLPLFTSTKVYHTHELAKIGLEVEQLREENERMNVEYDVSRAYYGLQYANAAMDVVSEAESYVSRIETEYQTMMTNGASSVKRTDQYRIDIAKANVYRLKGMIEGKQRYAEQALRIHTQLEGELAVETMDFDVPPDVLKSREAVQSLAESNRGDLKLLLAGERASEKQAHIAWLNWWPDLVLAGEAYYKFSNAVPKYEEKNFYIKDGYNGYGFALGFVLRWELDPVRQVFKVRQAEAQAEKARSQREFLTAGIALEVSEQYDNTLNALNNIHITHQSRRAAKRFLTQSLLDYEAGDGNVEDVVSAITTYIEQRSMYLDALNSYRVSLVKLQKLTGVSTPGALLEGAESE